MDYTGIDFEFGTDKDVDKCIICQHTYLYLGCWAEPASVKSRVGLGRQVVTYDCHVYSVWTDTVW
jgi:hypothetical protein